MPETGYPGKILLIVDHSLFIIDRILIILKEVNVVEKFFTATNFTEAVDIMQQHEIDIVLLDIQLPEKNGIELLKYMVEHFPGARVIVLSNLASDYYRKLCLDSGAASFIDKSKDFDSIPEIILSILS